jgi:hypothetical protein
MGFKTLKIFFLTPEAALQAKEGGTGPGAFLPGNALSENCRGPFKFSGENS